MGWILMLRSNVNATIYCEIEALIIGTWSCKEHSIAGSSFRTGHCFVGLPIVTSFENSFVMDATTNLNVEEDLSSNNKALLFKTDATTKHESGSRCVLIDLIWFVEVPGSRTNDANVLHEVLFCKGDGFTCHQCEDAAWNFCWWSKNQILYKKEPSNKPFLNSDKNGKLQRKHRQILWNFFVKALANWMVEYFMNQYYFACVT